jgi:hypothetical protein
MKRNWRVLVIIVLGITVFILGILILANRAQISKYQTLAKNDLAAVVEEYQRNAKYNRTAFPGLIKIAERANYNHQAIKTAAYILANVGFHTNPVLKIAEIAGSADHEVGHLDDLLELVIIYGGGTDLMVNLAREAANHEISEADLSARITLYRNQSPVKTIEEAVKKNDSQLDGVSKKIEAVIQGIQQQNNHQPQTKNYSQKERLMAAIQGYISNGHDNQALAELRKIAAKAGYNYSVIQTAAKFLSQEGSFHHWPVLNIARLAGGADREIKQLNDLLEVSIIYGGDSLTITELAIKAVKNEITEAELERRIAYYRNNSAAKTIDEALENSRKFIGAFQ